MTTLKYTHRNINFTHPVRRVASSQKNANSMCSISGLLLDGQNQHIQVDVLASKTTVPSKLADTNFTS